LGELGESLYIKSCNFFHKINKKDNSSNHNHNKDDIYNAIKAEARKSILMQTTKARAANGFHWINRQDCHINVNSRLYDIPVRKQGSGFVQDMYFQPLVFGSGVLLTGKVVEELAAYFQLK